MSKKVEEEGVDEDVYEAVEAVEGKGKEEGAENAGQK